MRIVGGRLGGLALAGPRSPATRPTSDRLRESLFNILAHGYGDPVADARVLDLFAGTGALGLEAMSRGAQFCLFVDDSAEARGVIRRNIEAAQLIGASRVFRRNALKLGAPPAMRPFTLAFADPPYGKSLGVAALTGAARAGWLAPGALCVLEEHAAAAIAADDPLLVLERRSFGDSSLIFFEVSAGGTGAADQPPGERIARGEASEAPSGTRQIR